MVNLCLSGGVALNCSMNGEIERSNLFQEIFVVPAAGDSGVSIGAAFEGYKSIANGSLTVKKRHNFYLGYRIQNQVVEETAKQYGYIPEELNGVTLADFAAQKLSEGFVIGIARNGAEFGPRALGNRSIVADPRSVQMRDHINHRVKFREGFRPFAPAVLVEQQNEFFHMSYPSPHMLRGIPASSYGKRAIPAVVHTDGSARVQSVDKELNPEFWDLINAFASITGVPVLLNTSLNVKGQPVVNTERDAFIALDEMNLDYMIIGDFIFKKR